MQANSLNNILLGANAPLQVKGQAGAVAGNNKPLAEKGMAEFASILNATRGQSAAAPSINLMQLLAQKLGNAPQLLNHPLMQKTTQALFGGQQEMALDNTAVSQLLKTPGPAGKLLLQLQSLLNSDPSLVQAIKNDPQAAALLKLQTVMPIGQGAAPQVQINPNATLAEIKSALVQQVQQQINPQAVAQGQDRILPQLMNRNIPQQQQIADQVNFGEKKNITRPSNPAMKQYAEGQTQFQSNIIKMPVAELEKTTSEVEFAQNRADAQVIPLMAHDQRQTNMTLQPQVNTTKQVIDLSQISASNQSELIEKISNYIQQNALQRVDGLDLTVKHADLGQFRISVTQHAGAENLNMQILTSSKEGHSFFKANQTALVRSLSDAGVSVGDMQIVSAAPSRSFADSQSSMDQRGSQFSSQQHSDRQQGDSHQRDSQRRRDLWEEYRQRFSA